MKKPIVLIIRDGWGYRADKRQNVLASTKLPNTENLMKNYSHVLIGASGEYVGLPKGYQGNSEVGHMTIGAGRIILDSLTRINDSIKDESFFSNKQFLKAISNCKKNKTKLHLIGLLQKEGVHSHINHLFALLDLCNKKNFKEVLIHVITDGRDAPVKKGINKIKKLNTKLKKLGFGRIVTLSGRYYAMDRDKRWDRTKKAYDCIVKGRSEEFNDLIEQVNKNYRNEETDEFMIPRKIRGYNGIKEKDSVIFYNFRTDRPRQLTKAIVEMKFEGWKRKPLNVYYVAMTEYYKPMNCHSAFKNIKIKKPLGEVLSNNKLKQLRISETEKYAHVTFFFNAQIETPYKLEDRILIHSPKVATYDKKPEMSAYKITNILLKELDKKKHDFIVINLVNGDMVGHTGIVSACKKAVQVVDECVGKITSKVLSLGGVALVFADHGNIEDQRPKWRTSHTTNKVPFILVSEEAKKIKLRRNCGLADIAPTVLDLFNIKKPQEMTGESIIKK